jgi:hypothetical protein
LNRAKTRKGIAAAVVALARGEPKKTNIEDTGFMVKSLACKCFGGFIARWGYKRKVQIITS